MNEFRRLAAKIDQPMHFTQSNSQAHAVINRMLGKQADLHKIWVGTSGQQRVALHHEFPGFYRHNIFIEETSEA